LKARSGNPNRNGLVSHNWLSASDLAFAAPFVGFRPLAPFFEICQRHDTRNVTRRKLLPRLLVRTLPKAFALAGSSKDAILNSAALLSSNRHANRDVVLPDQKSRVRQSTCGKTYDSEQSGRSSSQSPRRTIWIATAPLADQLTIEKRGNTTATAIRLILLGWFHRDNYRRRRHSIGEPDEARSGGLLPWCECSL
jgi:hypothetical protein